ncbi:hypothetical protein H4582DRAFT_2083724 [Lactarius indigo]|nr:hypothetical protein H4582DRAFT_2083724 [Lactarius indigo]
MTYLCHCTVAFATTSLAQVHTPPLFSHDSPLPLHCRVHYEFAGPGPYPTVVLPRATAAIFLPGADISKSLCVPLLSDAPVVLTPPIKCPSSPLDSRYLAGIVYLKPLPVLSPPRPFSFSVQRPLTVNLLSFVARSIPLRTRDRSWSFYSLSSFAGLPFKPKTAHGQFALFCRSLDSPSNQRPLTVNLHP